MRRRRIVWHYGHAGIAGSSPGYLNTPDDAYRLANGDTTVADIRNCRIVELSPRGTVVRILGGSCVHDPPRGFASPNGDTPAPRRGPARDRDRRLDRPARRPRPAPSGRSARPSRTPPTRSSCRTAGSSSPRSPIPAGSSSSPPSGKVTWSFGDSSGPNLLDKPSLAVRLPNGLIAANDDYGDRVILIDPAHPPHRLAVRTYRRRLVGARVPLEARRPRLPAGEGRTLRAGT